MDLLRKMRMRRLINKMSEPIKDLLDLDKKEYAAVKLTYIVNDKDIWAVDDLIDILKSHEGDSLYAGIRSNTASMLGTIRDRRAIPALISALLDEDGNVHEFAGSALYRIDKDWGKSKVGKQAVKHFTSILIKKNRSVKDSILRYRATAALGMTGDPSVAKALFSALRSLPPEESYHTSEEMEDIRYMRIVVFEALCNLSPPPIDDFVNALKDSNDELRRMGFEMMDNIMPEDSPYAVVTENHVAIIDRLIAALEDNYAKEEIRRHIIRGLKSTLDHRGLSELGPGPNEMDWRKWWKHKRNDFLKRAQSDFSS